MRYEIINIETASKLARIDKTLEYINNLLKQAYTKYRLSPELVEELLTIEKILMGDKNEQKGNIRIIQSN